MLEMQRCNCNSCECQSYTWVIYFLDKDNYNAQRFKQNAPAKIKNKQLVQAGKPTPRYCPQILHSPLIIAQNLKVYQLVTLIALLKVLLFTSEP